ncbi:tannase and feruloyl esterase [Cucurbitaria berberidis CBS 394.84]|uniref:Carboxylic ester hydrolase n=1 Tax=Cucurbitaria berberidis CBS 394.84 TaxID=1168544 RepID=A0A9P4L3T6_9PLEO|nr:tannase and feruloyl esterase [Cucurbitaria berberidis CBS 394.84]KAF1840637.1 tannase and feruloyl esterase [Cucurbitaria berberidis CBS 394.84]
MSIGSDIAPFLAIMFVPLLSASFLAFFQAAAAATSFESKCLSFRPEKYIDGATRNVRQFVTAGTTLTFPDNDATCNRASQAVSSDMCRIALSIRTSRTSSIAFEAWFPENWSGRFLATGNGGIDGCIKYEDLAYGALNGFATVGANNGKNGTSGLAFLNNPETVIDFAWRSLHTSVETGKKLSKKLYHETYTKSYYLGCSLGGRQGIKSAEKFPKDFDGIVAGAPGVDFNDLVSWRARFYTITGPKTGADFIPATAWKTWIHDEVLHQCDTIDKVKDGIIEDPTLCKFDPSTLLCSRNSTTNCLNQNQVQQVKTIFSDYMYPNGQLIFPAMQPGSEINAVDRLYAGTPFAYSDDWFKYVVYNNALWNASTFDFLNARAAELLNPGNIRTYPSKLPKFESRGGKLLIYHGQQDHQITAFNTNRFYENLRGRRSYASMDEWVRFFRVSGMFHCSSGPGAWVLGQGGNAAQNGIMFDRQHNVLKAMVDWVEKGDAPEDIEGTKFVNDTVSQGVDFTRRHCKFPARNTYTGGDYKKPSSWKCK